MRRLANNPFHLVVSRHVERQLHALPRKTEKLVWEELERIAAEFGKSPPPWRESWVMTFEVEGARVEYECAPANDAVIALDVLPLR